MYNKLWKAEAKNVITQRRNKNISETFKEEINATKISACTMFIFTKLNDGFLKKQQKKNNVSKSQFKKSELFFKHILNVNLIGEATHVRFN